jgi:beta-galactosidase
MLGFKLQMKSTRFLPIALAIFAAFLSNNSPAAIFSHRNSSAAGARLAENFDSNWHFLKADATNAEQVSFDDSAWRVLDVPHDWSIEGPFARTNRAGGAGAFLPDGVVWYRKDFTLPQSDAGRRISVLFDGVMANSDVWINGVHLGHRPYGYVSFCYELTGHLKFGVGQTNVLAVRADTSEQPASRWYAGAGIYRHVHLIATDPVHFEQWGVFVTTPQVDNPRATVRVQAAVTNESNLPREASLQITLIDPAGRKVASAETRPMTISPGDSTEFAGDVTVKKPKRWDLTTPVLYRALVRIRSGNTVLDDDTVPFGIREFHFDPATGFWLNGKNFKVKGVCLHACASAFGAAVPLSVWQERLETLRSLGVNAIRTAHNPPAPEFLDLCDRMGFLVMDEFFDCWTVGKTRYDYHLYFNEWSHADERDTILRDRNHPSIILYSVGNEIHDTPKAEMAKGILKGLVEVAHETDPTRPVTQALFRPNTSHDYDDGLAAMLDVVGTNYRDNELQAAQRAHPTWKIIGTEQRHDRQTWLWLRDSPSEAGQFLWSGIDYLGEALRWPVVAAGSGLLDRTGAPKPMAFERQSWWSDKPMVFITRRVAPTQRVGADPGFAPLRLRQVLFADWSPTNTQTHNENVEVYSNCKEVELFLNGKSLGAKTINADASPRNWDVPFAPGTLKAVARNEKGRVVATGELRTAGKPAKIVLSANRKKIGDDWNSVSEITARITDEHGVTVPTTDDLVSFTISDAGRIAAVDSADNSSHEPFQATERRAFQGRCVAFVKADARSGRIKVTATAPGLKSGSITLKAGPPASAE